MRFDLPATVGTPRGVSVEGAGAQLLGVLLAELEVELRRQKVPLDGLLQPAANSAEVHSTFAGAGLVPPDEAVTWFGWHDGCVGVPLAEVVLPRFGFWSLKAVAMNRSQTQQWLGLEEGQWNPNWLQIMGEADGLGISCEAHPSVSPLVRLVNFEDAGTQPQDTQFQVVSLCTPVSWWIDALRRGWYRWDQQTQHWDYDIRAQPLIRSMYGVS
jgi:hypothetical protein